MASQVGLFSALALVALALSSCGTYHTVTDLVTSHVPERHSGRASIVVDLAEQQAYLYRGSIGRLRPAFRADAKGTARQWAVSR